MKEWLGTHIDAVIPIVVGLYLALIGIVKRKSLSLDDAQKQQKLSLWGTVLIAIGIFQIFTGSIPATPSNPVTATTDDGKVSVVFPQEPVRTEATDEAAGVKVRRVTRGCNLRGIDLRLSYNEYLHGGKDAPKEALLATMKELVGKKALIVAGTSPFHEFVMEKPDVGARQTMRIWYGPGGIYRAMATTEKGYEDDPRALNFISSFRITAASPEK